MGVQLRLKNVHKKFGDHAVLRGIDLDIGSGEFVAVVGRSGGGKSTLLRMLAGLERPTDGEISLDTKPLTGVYPEVRMVFQDARLLPWKRVEANVRLGLKRRDWAKAREALRRVGLEDRVNAWPRVLSGGQRQRVALARALVWEPRLLLLDEPFGALDALTRLEMQRLVEDVWLQQGFTVVLVTHDVGEAVALADRVVVLENGYIGLEVPVTLLRPRQRSARFAELEQLILDRILGQPGMHARGCAAVTRESVVSISSVAVRGGS
jgi:sulfonate transport system ATP-binding protein